MKIGLEIHQQLKTGKLFCRCESVLRDDPPDIEIRRRLRSVAGETGERDFTGEAEASKGKTFVYQAYSDSTCLVEIDEEPPKPIDSEALLLAVEISKSLNCKMVPELHTMRKAIIDGSCPSGFQRTALLAKGGYLEIQGKKIGIESVCIEEDAGRIISSGEGAATFRLDRLGIPLVEITTAPEIESPSEAKEVAKKIGTILRMTGRVVRGLGSIRQDLNVSIEGGTRVEIKGVQELDGIPKIIETEAERQRGLISLAGKYPKVSSGEMAEVTGVFANTESKVLKGKRVFGILFPGLAGIMKEEIHPGKGFGKEVSGKVKVLSNAKGFFHTDELPNYGVTEAEVVSLRAFLGAGEKDLVAIVADDKHALEVVRDRVLLVPSGMTLIGETRKAETDGSSSFLRPISGSSRFYPETDVAPVGMEIAIKAAKAVESPESRLKRLEEMGLSKKLSEGLLLSENYPIFLLALEKGVLPVLAATIAEETLPYLRRKGVDVDGVSDLGYSMLFEFIASGKIQREGVADEIEKLALQKNAKKGAGEIIAGDQASEEAVKNFAKKLVGDRKEYISKEGKDRALYGLMGEMMREFKGKFPGASLKKILERELGIS